MRKLIVAVIAVLMDAGYSDEQISRVLNDASTAVFCGKFGEWANK